MNIAGISALFHDSAACLLQDGVLSAAAQEERFSRIKHDASMPKAAFRSCLEQSRASICDIHHLAYYEDPIKKLQRQIWMTLPNLTEALFERLWRRALQPETEIRECLGYEGKIDFVDHHESHAASAFYFSGYEEAAILTMDGVGEWTTTSYGQGTNDSLQLLEQVEFPHSVGLLYSALTNYLGFSVNDGEYKVMGLAPYGRPVWVKQIQRLIQADTAGQFHLTPSYFNLSGDTNEKMFSKELVELFGQPARSATSELTQFHKDVASSLQKVLEDILLQKAEYLYRRTHLTDLCMAGGVALNCVAVSRLFREGPFRRIFVQPAASDAGGALGAAAVSYQRHARKRPLQNQMRSTLLGPKFSANDIEALLCSCGLKAKDYRSRESELLDDVVRRLSEGKVIGWFQGRMEFGPRALGARSILADPRDPMMRDRINQVTKKREGFRPFAPAVLDHQASGHFDLDHESPLMTETCKVVSPIGLPAITHVDLSARVQTVNEHDHPRFARLIQRFGQNTGCPILLNTSFNMRDEPIVCNPTDAILCFARSDIDALVLEDFVIDRSILPSQWREILRGLPRQNNPAVSDSVYTLL